MIFNPVVLGGGGSEQIIHSETIQLFPSGKFYAGTYEIVPFDEWELCAVYPDGNWTGISIGPDKSFSSTTSAGQIIQSMYSNGKIELTFTSTDGHTSVNIKWFVI